MEVIAERYGKIYMLAGISFVAIVGISLMKAAPELEDAEQAYYSQWWRWGYDDQPPLYTWIQNSINTVMGVSKWSFSLLRGLLFGGVLLLLYRFSMTYLGERNRPQLVVLGLVLIPVFIDFTFRRLSHTTLLCVVVLATYCIIHQLISKKTFLNYMLLGLVVGLGILTKYNYALVLLAIGMSLFVDTSIRRILFHPYFLISMIVMVLIISPHIYWLWENAGFQEEIQSSFQMKIASAKGIGIPILSPLLALLLTLLKLCGFLLLLVFVLLKLKKLSYVAVPKDWLMKLFMSQLLVLIFFFVITDVQKVEERWLLPIFLPFLALLFQRISLVNSDRWVTTGYFLFLFVVGMQTIRTPVEKLLDIPSSVHFSFVPVAQKLMGNYPETQWILPDVTYAGSVRLLCPERRIFARDDFSLPETQLSGKEIIEVVSGRQNLNNRIILDSISNFGMQKEQLYFVSR